MARITYRTRLQDLLAKPYLSQSDRRFAQSLLDHYNLKKYMSAGRAKWVRTLEERYAVEPTCDEAMVSRLDSVASRITDNQWARDFVGSLTSQVKAGRDLSEKQVQILTKIEAEHSDDAIAAAASFADTFANDETMSESFRIMVEYYRGNGYYSSITRQATEIDGFVPTQKQYKAITDNKFATKILAGWFTPAKYPIGSMVDVRSGASPALSAACGHGPTRKPAAVLAVNAEYPHSACKGNKIYKVLPVGCAQTFLVEERHIKRLVKRRKKA